MADTDILRSGPSAAAAAVRERIAGAAKAAGRTPKDIMLCAVCKTQSIQTIMSAAAADINMFGENRAEELERNIAAGAYGVRPVHFIGHLQSRKARDVVGRVSMIQSVDSSKLLRLIDRLASERGIVQDVLIEVNIAREESKNGVMPETLDAIIAESGRLRNIMVCGLMAIPPVADLGTENDRYFAQLYKLFIDINDKKYDNVSMDYLSMGMSRDFESAIRHGANIVRIGTSLFGPRG